MNFNARPIDKMALSEAKMAYGEIMLKPQIKTLIVGADFSENSQGAMQEALVLKELTKARLVIVHVGYLPDHAEDLVDKNFKRHLSEKTEGEIRKFYHLSHDLKFDIHVVWGQPAEQILKVIKKYPAPLVIVARSGRSTFGRLLLGSTAEMLAVTSPHPVLIHHSTRKTEWKEALVAVDLSGNSLKLIKFARDFCKRFEMGIKGLYVSAPLIPTLDYAGYQVMYDEVIKQRKIAFSKLQKQVPQTQIEWKDGQPVEELLQMAETSGLLILCPHNRPRLAPTFGSVSAKVVRHAPCDVLVIPVL